MQHLYFIGLDSPILVGLAIAAKQLGFAVSGSTQSKTGLDPQLLASGVHAHTSFDAHHIHPESIVVLADHIAKTNVELKQAQLLDIDIVSSSQLIQQLSQNQTRIVVLGSSLTAISIATMLSGLSSVDMVCQQPMAATELWQSGQAILLNGSPTIVIDANLQPASKIDNAAQALYYQPHCLVLAFDDQQPLSTKELAIIEHMLKDMANAPVSTQAPQVILPTHQKSLIALLRKLGLSFTTYGQQQANWQAKKVEYSPAKTVFWLYQDAQQIDMLTSPLIGQQGLTATLCAIATAELWGMTMDQSLLRLGLISGTNWHTSIAVDGDRRLECINLDPLHSPDFELHLQQAIKQYQSNSDKLWMVFAPMSTKDMALLLHQSNLQGIDILISEQLPMQAPKWLQSMVHYQLDHQEMAHFVAKNAGLQDTIIVCGRSPQLEQLSHSLTSVLQ